MPLKTVKKDSAEALTLEWILHVRNYKLNLDKHNCVGCQICSLACPKEAIRLLKQSKVQGEKAKKAIVDIDLTKCNFCGICDVLCPYGAIKLTIDGTHMLSVVEKQSFPSLVRDIKANPIKFPVDPQTTKDSCPLGLITVSYSTADGKPIENPRTLKEPERSWYKTTVNIDKDHCPCCTVCEAKLPDGTIYVRKFLNGKLTINTAKCPDGCKDCLDVCPITSTLYLSNDNKKVHLDETFCVYCGACKMVCPVNDALELKRTRIIHSPIRSGAWNKALERLTSPTDLTKELKMKGSQKAREAVRKRMVREAQQTA